MWMKTWMFRNISPSWVFILHEWIYLKAWKNCVDVNDVEKKQYSMKLNWEIVNAPLKWLYMNVNMVLTIPVVYISHISHIKNATSHIIPSVKDCTLLLLHCKAIYFCTFYIVYAYKLCSVSKCCFLFVL